MKPAAIILGDHFWMSQNISVVKKKKQKRDKNVYLILPKWI